MNAQQQHDLLIRQLMSTMFSISPIIVSQWGPPQPMPLTVPRGAFRPVTVRLLLYFSEMQLSDTSAETITKKTIACSCGQKWPSCYKKTRSLPCRLSSAAAAIVSRRHASIRLQLSIQYCLTVVFLLSHLCKAGWVISRTLVTLLEVIRNI